MKKTILRKYAKLAVVIGANVQKGQYVIINASTNQVEFVKYVVEEAYKAKAKSVKVEWSNEDITRLKWKKESESTLKEVPQYLLEERQFLVDKLPCRIYIDDSNPNIFKGLDMQKMSTVQRVRYASFKKYSDAMDNRYQWTIVAMPSKAWAKSVFPNDKPNDAMKKLEEAIIKTTRLDYDDPSEAWFKHIAYLQDKASKLNNYNFKTLTYKASNGTDLTIGLQENHVWISARETHLGGLEFSANMPTEEVFTMPAKFSTNGVVVSSKPLSYRGNIIDGFKIHFKDGKAIKVEARENEALLKEMINMDEASSYLGEVALVPFDSPINQTNILFLNTLFDENACCHLALGEAFKNNIKDYEKMSEKDFKDVNYNESMIHVDFMIGTADLSIVGTTKDDQQVQVFKNGVWSF